MQDYHDIVKRPMDLGTIRKKLDSGQYKDPWEYADDVWLVFDNAWLYNRKNSRVYKYCSKVFYLKDIFSIMIFCFHSTFMNLLIKRCD